MCRYSVDEGRAVRALHSALLVFFDEAIRLAARHVRIKSSPSNTLIRGAVERMMRELGGGGFNVRPLSQFTAPLSGTASDPTGPSSSAADESEADPRGIQQLDALCCL